MLLIKITGIVMILFCSVGIGLYKAQSLVKRLSFLRQSKCVMSVCKEQMYYYRRELSDIYSSNVFPEFAGQAAEIFREVFSGSRVLDTLEFLNTRDKQIISEFASGLGMSETETQMQRCEILMEDIREQIEDARQQVSSKQKLYTALSLSVGMCISLMII